MNSTRHRPRIQLQSLLNLVRSLTPEQTIRRLAKFLGPCRHLFPQLLGDVIRDQRLGHRRLGLVQPARVVFLQNLRTAFAVSLPVERQPTRNPTQPRVGILDIFFTIQTHENFLGDVLGQTIVENNTLRHGKNSRSIIPIEVVELSRFQIHTENFVTNPYPYHTQGTCFPPRKSAIAQVQREKSCYRGTHITPVEAQRVAFVGEPQE